ncbi:STAS domain-containing protein [Pseudonocardia sp. KRD-182]|uniref:STAS domain-containing protein n=1 Tax=Pseudonocardia oceani TaxID=2792013 RepID=UPI001C4A2E1B|nr:STAS domain-containing protein [Pseudonocardia oceani]MBW0108587.1 STAS domain-containing protein [Pseudonocardia oceani]
MPSIPFRTAAPPDGGVFAPAAVRPRWWRQAELAELEHTLGAVMGASPAEQDPPVTIASAQRGDGFAALVLGGPPGAPPIPALVPHLRAVLDAGARHLVVDLSRTRRLDGQLAAILHEVAVRMAARGGVLDLTGLTPRVLHGLDDEALARVFLLYRAAFEDGTRAELSWAARRCPQGLDEVAEPRTAARHRSIIDTAGRRPAGPR